MTLCSVEDNEMARVDSELFGGGFRPWQQRADGDQPRGVASVS